jgi:hypothetical protein
VSAPGRLGYLNMPQSGVADISTRVHKSEADGSVIGVFYFGEVSMHVLSPEAARQIVAAFAQLADSMEIAAQDGAR